MSHNSLVLTHKDNHKDAEKDAEDVAEDVHENDSCEGDGQAQLPLPFPALTSAQKLPCAPVEILNLMNKVHQTSTFD